MKLMQVTQLFALIAVGTVKATNPTNPWTLTALHPDPTGENCPQTSMPHLCTADATISGEAMHLTYLCPESKVGGATVVVTVTKTTTVTPTITEIASSVESPDGHTKEPMTTITVHSKLTVYTTITVHSAKHSSGSVVASLVSETSPELITSRAPTEATASVITTELTSAEPLPATSSEATPIEVSSDSDIVVTSTVTIDTTVTSDLQGFTFPTLSLTTSNGTAGGISYTRSVCNSSFVPTGSPTISPSLDGREAQDHSATDPYPGAQTIWPGKLGGTDKNGVPMLALFLSIMVAALLL